MSIIIIINQGFPLEFYFGGHKSPLTLVQGDNRVILGDIHMTHNRKRQILGDIMSLMKGNLGDFWRSHGQNLPFLRDRENPALTVILNQS